MVDRAKDPVAVELGRRGGRAYAEGTPEHERRNRAKQGAEARWQKKAEAVVQRASKMERRVDALITTFLAGGAQRCTFIMRQGEIWTTDPEGEEFKRFTKHAPRCIVGTYDRSVTRAAVMQDVEELQREGRR